MCSHQQIMKCAKNDYFFLTLVFEMYQKRINSKRLLGKLLYQNPLFKFGITAIFLIISIIQPLSLIITQKKQTGNTYSENRSTNKYEHQFDLFIEEESSEEDENHHELGSVNKLFNKDYFFQVLHFDLLDLKLLKRLQPLFPYHVQEHAVRYPDIKSFLPYIIVNYLLVFRTRNA